MKPYVKARWIALVVLAISPFVLTIITLAGAWVLYFFVEWATALPWPDLK